MPAAVEYWESEATRPEIQRVSEVARAALAQLARRALPTCLTNPFASAADIDARQLDRVRELVELAYDRVPVYRDKYRAAGLTPRDLRSWDDFECFPVITKAELAAAFPERCLNPRFARDDLFATRSAGSSGQVLPIRVDLYSVLVDTLQGVRQLWLQSAMRYQPEHLAAHIYTMPWWFDHVGDDYPTAFISSLIPAERIAALLGALRPTVLSLYPTNLRALLAHGGAFGPPDLLLVVTHSEQSSALERRAWSNSLGVPVLDEYSSGEATRIALELPCGHYHVCDDTVVLEVLEPATLQPQRGGVAGLAVVTNLLNEAMPFIRYVQGDLVRRPAVASSCSVSWSQLEAVEGRVNDSFINRWGREVPAGTLLDVTYRWMMDTGVNLAEFQLRQEEPERVRLVAVRARTTSAHTLRAALTHLRELLTACIQHPVQVELELRLTLAQAGKRRPIRRCFPVSVLNGNGS
jgi:phenylacetate-CoA ligase